MAHSVEEGAGATDERSQCFKKVALNICKQENSVNLIKAANLQVQKRFSFLNYGKIYTVRSVLHCVVRV